MTKKILAPPTPGVNRQGRFIRLDSPELNNGISMTEPEQVNSLEQILKHRGTNVQVPIFNGVFANRETPDIAKMDFIDIAELLEVTREGIEQANEDLHALAKRQQVILDEAAEKAKTLEEGKEKPPVSPLSA